MDKLSSDLSNYDEFIKLIKDEDVQNFVKFAIDESREWNNGFYNESEVLIDRILEKPEFKALENKYNEITKDLQYKI